MTRSYALIDRDNWPSFFGLVFFCGAALVLSVPGARAVQELGYVQQASRTAGLNLTWIFLDAYVFCVGLFGLRLGSASAERGERGARMVGALVLRILIGQALCLPYLIFSLSLFPSREGGLALVALLASVTALYCALLNRLVEERARLLPSSVYGYVFFAGIAFIPLVGIPILSPIGAVELLVDSSVPFHAPAAFAVPGVLLLIAAVWTRTRGKFHGSPTST